MLFISLIEKKSERKKQQKKVVLETETNSFRNDSVRNARVTQSGKD